MRLHHRVVGAKARLTNLEHEVEVVSHAADAGLIREDDLGSALFGGGNAGKEDTEQARVQKELRHRL